MYKRQVPNLVGTAERMQANRDDLLRWVTLHEAVSYTHLDVYKRQGSAWEQYRYRTAADYAFKAGGELPPGPIRAEFGLLVAEAWFRAGLLGKDSGDFRSAADAYAAALRSRPEGVRPGLLMFQRVQSEIEAGALGTAVTVLDDLARDPAFDAEDRWEAEWNLARSLEVHGETAEAYDRVNRLLLGPVSYTHLDVYKRQA